MVRLPVLQPPVLRYKGGTMIISIPRQRLRVQEDITELPQFVLGYAGGEKILPIQHQRFGDELFLDELHAEISDLTLEGLYFRWFSFVKYWPLMLEPIMVFDNAGNLRDRDWLPNGFYYIVASNGWSTDAREIITSYPCGVPGYTVYETELIESRIVFRSRLGEGQAVINASAIRDACLVGFEHLPGVTHDGIPLGKDRGLKMIVSRKLVDSPGKYRLHLTYNGYQLYNEALDKVVEELDGEKNSTVVSLDLKKAVRARMDRQPKWEEYTIEIINELEETNYTEAICLSSGLDVAFEMNQIVLSVPKGSIIDHPDANREGHAYIFPTTGVSRINGRICVPRIGWKRFSIDVPGGTCHLVDQTGMELPMPHQFLKSEYQKLSSFSIVFKAQNALVDQVQLLDRDLNLLMEFGLKNGRAEIPLLPVIELWRNEPGDDKLYLVWTGVENSRGRFMIIEAFERLEVTDAELFVSEQADEYVIELRYKLNFVYPTKLHFRIGYQHNRGRIIFHREIEADLDYFYLRKDQLDDVYLYGEIYYVHTEESVFGIEQKEQVLWIYDFILSQWEERLKKAIDRGLILRSAQVYWNGGLKRVLFPKDKFRITQIEPSSKDIMYFEGDRLLQGVIKQDYRIDHVCFYLEEDVNRLAFLCDQDYDGAMYDPISQRLFWNDEPKHAVGPLEEIDFEFAEVVEDES